MQICAYPHAYQSRKRTLPDLNKPRLLKRGRDVPPKARRLGLPEAPTVEDEDKYGSALDP